MKRLKTDTKKDSQLMRYISLGVLTEKQAEKIKALENE